MELGKNMAEIMNIYNFFDSVIVTDDKGVIKYYANMRTDVYRADAKDIVGLHIFELHPELTEETSSIMRVLKTGEPVFNQLESFYSLSGQSVTNIYCTLPLLSDGKIVGAIDFARVVGKEERKNIVLSSESDGEKYYTVKDIITLSPDVIKIKDLIPQVAQTDSSVLIYGETGTGKDMIAQAIHSASNRCSRRFVALNCAAIPASLLEGILFGTKRGSYTGAEDRAGLFELADGGTLFLDEINSMDIAMQAKLLRAIEEKKVMRVGGSDSIPINVKIVSATNRSPMESIETGHLRQDLFYRLNVVQFYLPPLRERKEDIQLLTNHFIYRYNLKMNKHIQGIDGDVRTIFNEYSWPGNVRELQNIIEGAFNITGFKVIRREDLPDYLLTSYDKQNQDLVAREIAGNGVSLNNLIADYEKAIIRKALDSAKTVAEAARKLDLSKQDLGYKMKKYELRK